MSDNTIRRVARKRHRCESVGYGTCPPIEPGDAYLVHTSFPGSDSGYADAAGHPVRLAECMFCAARYQRDYLIEPIPAVQQDRYYAGIASRGLL